MNFPSTIDERAAEAGLPVSDFIAREVSHGRMTNSLAHLSDPAKPKAVAQAAAPAQAAASRGLVTAAAPESTPTYGVRFTQADIDRAVARAVSFERARITAVFAEEASHGRERACAELLASAKGFAAGHIVAELPDLPTDARRAAVAHSERQATRTQGILADQRAAHGLPIPAAKQSGSDEQAPPPPSKVQQILADQRGLLNVKRN